MRKILTYKLNWRPSRPDFRDIKYERHAEVLAANPPNRVPPPQPLMADLRGKMPPIVDQGNWGSCTANAIAGAIGFLECKEMMEHVELLRRENPNLRIDDRYAYDPLSRMFIYFGERAIEGDTSDDSGAQLRDGMKSINRWGVCREDTWPYLDGNIFKVPSKIAYAEAWHHKTTSYYSINDGDLGQMKICLVAGYPFVFGFTVYESFMNIGSDGIMPMPQANESVIGGHAVCAVGILENGYHIIRNSWGTNWGDGGYFYMPNEYISNPDLASDFWTIRRF